MKQETERHGIPVEKILPLAYEIQRLAEHKNLKALNSILELLKGCEGGGKEIKFMIRECERAITETWPDRLENMLENKLKEVA
jgi:hypothetical protein